MVRSKVLLFSVLGIIMVAGCAGKGERIDVLIPGTGAGERMASTTVNGPRIAVLPFDDQRANQAHLGMRSHLWGGVSYFDLPSGTVPRAASQALVDYLNRQGWKASLARTVGSEGADITITGTIQDLSIDATSGFMHTDLTAKNSMKFQIANHADESVVRERVSGSGSDQVFWFEPTDAQRLTDELFEKNFQKLIGDLRIEGRMIRLK
ncbi:MAG: hypothetical protein RI101_10905 [Nitrospira sp.]|nr:hypothetical protein [Nitrospira sp.]